MNDRHKLATLVIILLLAAALRWAALADMNDMLGFDESYYAADAASLLDTPRLTPFFPNNNGRESGWMYLLAFFIAGAGVSPFTVRLAATCVGVLSVAATYRLGREMFGAQVGLGAAAGMAVLYWPVHLSHIAMRANLLPLLGALSLAFSFTAHRTNRAQHWATTGLLVGAMTYTYTSAQIWVALILLILIVQAAVDHTRRRGALTALIIAIVIATPLISYVSRHPDQALMRASQSATLSIGALVGAVEAWMCAWFARGDILFNHNIPGRPILDWATGILFIAGLPGMIAIGRRAPWRIALVCALALISILPSLLSEFPPHFLRSIGLTVPIALALGAGATTLAQLTSDIVRRMRPMHKDDQRNASYVMPATLFLATSIVTYRDFHHVWLNSPGTTLHFERPTHQAAAAIAQLNPSWPNDAPIYFAPYELTHPVIQFSQRRLSPHRIGAFDSRACLVVPILPAIYAVRVDMDPDFAAALAEWGDQATVLQLTGSTLLRLAPDAHRLVRADDFSARFGGAIEVRVTTAPSTTARPGDRLSWKLRFRASDSLHRPYSLFVHLYRIEPTGRIDSDRKWAQGDQQMCASYPTTLWRSDEFVVQAYNLDLPADLPAGRYVVAIGVYDIETGKRLNTDDGQTYTVLQQIEMRTLSGSE